MVGEPATDLRIEGHDRDRAAIALEGGGDGPAERGDIPIRGLGLDEEGRAAADQPEDFRERGNSLVCGAERDPAELPGGMGREPACFRREPVELVIVEDHGLAVAARLDVQLNAEAAVDRGREGGPAVLEPTAAVQPPVGERPGYQLGEAGQVRLVSWP